MNGACVKAGTNIGIILREGKMWEDFFEILTFGRRTFRLE
jgi:hypothetical protein